MVRRERDDLGQRLQAGAYTRPRSSSTSAHLRDAQGALGGVRDKSSLGELLS